MFVLVEMLKNVEISEVTGSVENNLGTVKVF